MLMDHTLKCLCATKTNLRSLASARNDNARSWPRTYDNVSGFTQSLSDEIGQIFIGFTAIPGADQKGFYAGGAAAFQIAILVADEKRAGKIDIVISRGIENHFGRWLATFATGIGQMRTKICGINQVLADLSRNFGLDRAILFLREVPARNSTLVGDHNQFVPADF